MHSKPEFQIGPTSTESQHLERGHCLRMSPWDEETTVMLHDQMTIQKRSLSPFKAIATSLSFQQSAQKKHVIDGYTSSAAQGAALSPLS